MKAGPLLVLKCFCLVTLAVPWQTFRQDMDHASIIKAQMQRAGSQAGIAYIDLYMWLSSHCPISLWFNLKFIYVYMSMPYRIALLHISGQCCTYRTMPVNFLQLLTTPRLWRAMWLIWEDWARCWSETVWNYVYSSNMLKLFSDASEVRTCKALQQETCLHMRWTHLKHLRPRLLGISEALGSRWLCPGTKGWQPARKSKSSTLHRFVRKLPRSNMGDFDGFCRMRTSLQICPQPLLGRYIQYLLNQIGSSTSIK